MVANAGDNLSAKICYPNVDLSEHILNTKSLYRFLEFWKAFFFKDLPQNDFNML